MIYILQVNFPIDGPFGQEMSTQFADLAKSINEEPGFLWKIWTENADEKEAGGIYAFDSYENAENYLNMHSERLKSMGVPSVNAKIFATNDTLTKITHGRLTYPNLNDKIQLAFQCTQKKCVLKGFFRH